MREHAAILLESEDESEALKAAKFAFFKSKLHNEIGLPKNTALAQALCELLIDSRKATSYENLCEIIADSWFLRKNIFDRDHDRLRRLIEMRSKNPIVSREDLTSINRGDFAARKEREILERAKAAIQDSAEAIAERKTRERLSEIEARYKEMTDQVERERAQVNADKAELSKVKAVLGKFEAKDIDDIPYLPPAPLAPGSDSKGMVWWERLGLFGNPFPTVDGLSKIDAKYHEEVVLRTELFSRYHETATSRPEDMTNKTILITGEYGSGKTTLFDYLRKPMLTHDLLPLHLLVDAEEDKDRIRRSFYHALLMELVPIYLQATGTDPRSLFEEVGKEELFEILHLIVESKRMTGVVILLDGLHKNDEYSREALGFIQILQNTKDYWIRRGLNVGILIAGSKDWDRELRLNPAIRGSIDRIDEIPSITGDQAFEMLSRRLGTFSKDRSRPARIRRAAVDKVYHILRDRYARDVTFRDIVEEIQPHLERTDLGYVEISLPFDKELLRKLRLALEQSPELMDSINRLRKRTDTFLPCIQLLSILLERKRIHETDQLFEDNEALFAILHKVDLIQLVRNSETGLVYWAPRKHLIEFGRRVETSAGLRPSSFLVDLFAEAPKQPAVFEPEEILRLRNLGATYRTSDRILAEAFGEALAAHQEIVRHADSPQHIIQPPEVVGKTTSALETLLKCVFITIEPRTSLPFGKTDAKGWLAQSWIVPPEVTEFLREIDRELKGPPSQKESDEIVRSYLRAARTLTALIEQLVRCNSIANLSSPDLRKADKVALHQARSHFANQSYFDASRALTDYMEGRIREFLHDVFSIKYGQKWRARLGTPANEYIVDQKKRSTSVLPAGIPSQNDLYYCTRQLYRPMICEDKANWSQVFEFCFRPEKKEWASETLHLLFSLGDKDKHNEPNEYFREVSPKLLQALLNSVVLLGAINRSYAQLVSPENVFVETDEEGSKVVFFSFANLNDKTNLNPLHVPSETGKKVVARLESLMSSGSASFDLADRVAVEFSLAGKYREVLGVVAMAVKLRLVTIEFVQGSVVTLRPSGR